MHSRHRMIVSTFLIWGLGVAFLGKLQNLLVF